MLAAKWGPEFLKHVKMEPITEPRSGKTLPLFFGYVAEVKRWRKYQKQTQKQDIEMHKETHGSHPCARSLAHW